MAKDSLAEQRPKSLADVLSEEIDGAISPAATQEQTLEEKQARLVEVYQCIHRLEPERTALCLSGGGIRSATFALGALQALARHGLLGTFDYLSTVSGGGYAGGWLSAWIRGNPKGLAGLLADLGSPPGRPLNPEHEPVRHLRAYSNFLTPRLGLLSLDSWTLAATALRNMVLNWLILLSCFAALLMIPRFYAFTVLVRPEPWVLMMLLAVAALCIAGAMGYSILTTPLGGKRNWPPLTFLWARQIPLCVAALCLATWWAGLCNTQPGVAYLKGIGGSTAFVGAAILVYLAGGIASETMLWLRGETAGRKLGPELGRFLAILAATALGGLYLWVLAAYVFPNPAGAALNYACFAPALLLGFFLVVNFLFSGLASWVSLDADREWWGRSAAWLLLCMLGWIVFAVVALRGPLLLAFDKNAALEALLGAVGGVAGLAGAIFGFSRRTSGRSEQNSGNGLLANALVAGAAVLFFLLLSVGVSRLIDGGSGLSKDVGHFYNASGEGEPPAQWTMEYRRRVFHTFTLFGTLSAAGMVMGFFINANKFSLHSMYRNRLIRAFLGAARRKDERQPNLFTGFDPSDNFPMTELVPGRPFHIVNIALNVVKGQDLAWQERRAQSFTVSRLHAGNWHVGYRPSTAYGEAISLGTALTISGAAANPNMGYHSSPIVGFLMTLFNVRLGWWLGNPGSAGARTWYRPGPRYAVGPLISEALGTTSDAYPYVNLSDGGHFENLGLYEMVLRRCRRIVVIDAGCDPEYVHQDLGNAIRKIRIDLGIPVEVKVSRPAQNAEKRSCFAAGKIRYSAIDGAGTDGTFIYVKPVIVGDEPADIGHYAAAHPEFPHEGTADQWFSEAQLESYRMLGNFALEQLLSRPGGLWGDGVDAGKSAPG